MINVTRPNVEGDRSKHRNAEAALSHQSQLKWEIRQSDRAIVVETLPASVRRKAVAQPPSPFIYSEAPSSEIALSGSWPRRSRNKARWLGIEQGFDPESLK